MSENIEVKEPEDKNAEARSKSFSEVVKESFKRIGRNFCRLYKSAKSALGR